MSTWNRLASLLISKCYFSKKDAMSHSYAFIRNQIESSKVQSRNSCNVNALATFLEHVEINPNEEFMLIKMDIEGQEHEQAVIPSLVTWIQGLKRKPTFFISFHNGVQSNATAVAAIEKFFHSFRYFVPVCTSFAQCHTQETNGGFAELPIILGSSVTRKHFPDGSNVLCTDNLPKSVKSEKSQAIKIPVSTSAAVASS